MPQESQNPDPENKKNQSRVLLGAACEVLEGAAHASAEAFHTLNSHLSGQQTGVVEGILKGNARFLEEMSRSMNAVAERFKAAQGPSQ